MTGGWAAVGPASGDTAYRTQTLRFTAIEGELDESVSLRALFRLWLYAAIVAGVVFWILFIVTVCFGSSAASSSLDDSGNGDPFGLFAGLLGFAGITSTIVFFLVLLLVRVTEPVGEWKTLIEGKAGAAESAYAAIYGSLARRRIPVATAPMRVRSDILNPEVVNNRLVLTERSYVAYVSVFAYGTSLYVGWMMWRHRRGAVLIGIFIKDLFGSMFGRTGPIQQMLRTEKVRAMREATHSAVREGVDAAIAGLNVPIMATFGYDIPVQDLAAPEPVNAPTPALGSPHPSMPTNPSMQTSPPMPRTEPGAP